MRSSAEGKTMTRLPLSVAILAVLFLLECGTDLTRDETPTPEPDLPALVGPQDRGPWDNRASRPERGDIRSK